MKCRGSNIRRIIVQEYYVAPVAHLKILDNRPKHSDAEAIITDEYYIFIVTSKYNGSKDTITCGMGAARDFLKLLGHSGLPLFNPIKEEVLKSSVKDCKTDTSEFDSDWNPTGKQLYNAIMWLISVWDAKIDTPLFKIKDNVVAYKKYPPSSSNIKSVNTIIKNGGKGKTLTEIIEDFRKHNNLKNSMCQFDLLKTRIVQMTDKNGNKLKSYF